jgi:hypothetical protein
MDKKEIKRLYDIEYRKRPDVIEREKRRKQSSEYKEYNKQILKKRRVLNHKNVKFNEWRKQGIKWNINVQDPYEMYLDNKKCSICNNDYKNSADKHLDHDHLSGHIRGFVCRSCNSKMMTYDNLRIRLCLDLHRYFK